MTTYDLITFQTTSEQTHVRSQGSPAATAWPSGGLSSAAPPSHPASKPHARDHGPYRGKRREREREREMRI